MRWPGRVTIAASLACGVALPLLAGHRIQPPPQAAGAVALAADDEVSAFTAETTVPGMTVTRRVSVDVSRPTQVSWPVIPGATRLTALLQEWADDAEAGFLARTAPGGSQPPELTVSGSVIRAVGSVVVVRMSAVVENAAVAGSGTTRASRVFYADLDRNEACSGASLFAEAARAQTAQAVILAAAASEVTVPEAGGPGASVLDNADLTPTGDVLVALDAPTSSPRRRVVSVTLPALQVRPALSDLGRRIEAVIASGRPYAGPLPDRGPAATPGNGADPGVAAVTPAVLASPTPTPAPAPSGAEPSRAVDCAVLKCVALTYDDGPGPETGRLLDILTASQVKATFFVLGRSVTAYPDVVRREADLGMAIGNHTWNHRDMRRLTVEASLQELGTTRDLVERTSGAKVTVMRPPYGAFDERTRTLGWPVVLWDVDSEDWRNRSATVTTQRVLSAVRPGSIVLMHDIHGSSVDATPGIIAALKGRGFVFVTVPELLGQTSPGALYFNRTNVR
ncbi:MAG: polysaccharide deacetylase family protein [Actinomycetales bacterium]|nr:polysaccharide deacetylase family protein [Actinomycetales bacterium]